MCNYDPIEKEELTHQEQARFNAFKKEVDHWFKMLLIDPLWNVDLVVMDDEAMGEKTAYADIGRSEYWHGEIGIAREALETPLKEASELRQSIISHEMLHILTADYHRACITAAGKDERLQEEIIYRYEQLICKLSKILSNMDTALRYASKKK
jgi:hypothetical protein